MRNGAILYNLNNFLKLVLERLPFVGVIQNGSHSRWTSTPPDDYLIICGDILK